MKSRLDKALRKAFERERKREEADPTIPAQRAEIMKRLAEADRRRAEEQRQAEEERRAEAQRADAANARLLSFQSSRPKPIPEPASVPKFGKLVDPKTCPHLLTSYGHCEQCGESVIQGDGVAWYRKKHGGDFTTNSRIIINKKEKQKRRSPMTALFGMKSGKPYRNFHRIEAPNLDNFSALYTQKASATTGKHVLHHLRGNYKIVVLTTGATPPRGTRRLA